MAASPAAAETRPQSEPFRYCLNTSTLQGHKLSLVEEIEIAAQAGYQAIEPWIAEIERHVEAGGSLKDLEQRLRDRGLTVESAIGFAEWIVDDDTRRARGLEQMRRDMDLVAQLGGKRIAAPPFGATNQPDLDLLQAAERYRAVLELGERMGVVPQVEVWGFSQILNRLGQAALVAIESGHPQACILADVYHLYKGGSDYTGLRLLNGNAMHVLHMNDYPAHPPRETIGDADRVYPGDGIAPLSAILRALKDIGFHGALSLELFNKDYWQQDALTVARTGLEKMRAAVQKSLD
ncbi:MAG TPA: sugar phosphate isomerase/epimerase [Chthonomonadaceae bacterium]|nr:sugar phosphate isomerase/epimerase [Chthonomonadaceae bacterium]